MHTFPLPASPVARAVLATARRAADPSLLNHSVRSFWYARRIAARDGTAAGVDEDLLFAATVLHEMGATPAAPGRERFEIEGADIAATTLLGLGVHEADVQQVWDAIALHTSAGLAERRGSFARIVRAGILADFERGAEADDRTFQDDLHTVWPRMGVETTLVDQIIARGRGDGALPRYGFGGVLARERAERGITDLEVAARVLGW